MRIECTNQIFVIRSAKKVVTGCQNTVGDQEFAPVVDNTPVDFADTVLGSDSLSSMSMSRRHNTRDLFQKTSIAF